MKLLAIVWASYGSMLKTAFAAEGFDVEVFATKRLTQDPAQVQAAIAAMDGADLILLYRTSEGYWPEIEAALPASVPVVTVGMDPALWRAATVPVAICARAHAYLHQNGSTNLGRLARFLKVEVLGQGGGVEDPAPEPWEGLYHPAMGQVFTDTESYLAAYHRYLGHQPAAHVGVLMARTNWVTGNLAVEAALFGHLEALGIGVIPAFLYSPKDAAMGNLGGIEVVERFIAGHVTGLIKLNGYLLGSSASGLDEGDAGAGAVLLSRLGIPLFNPTIAFSQTVEEWRANPAGLGMQAAWSVAMPEFEGAIEPMVIGALNAKSEDGRYAAIPDRVERFAARVARWLAARAKPASERKVAFILHNNPCVGAEASVGGGAHLDTLETVSRVMKRLKAEGYAVEPPDSGKALIDAIMNKKAISEFRWTTTDEIVAKGGVLARVSEDSYRIWFDQLPAEVRERMSEAWGEPPGQPKDGVPAAMVHGGDILVTGLSFGNAVVLAQPKRGCAGARCDGTVCRILHDPLVPPPHQYFATYKWLSREFGADLLVHVGTHGNTEFLPGKSVGMSESCFSDIAIDTMPHLYIYNCDNPPEGTAAKRRANAVLVDHMQTVVVPGQLYGDLEALDRLLDDYHKLAEIEPAKAHSVAHLIAEKAKGLQLFDHTPAHDEVEAWIDEIHNRVTLLKNTRIPKGMHIFGEVPEGERLAEFVHGIARWDNGPDSLRGLIKAALGGGDQPWESEVGMKAETKAREAVKALIERNIALAVSLADLDMDARRLDAIEADLRGLAAKVEASEEMEALTRAFEGGFVDPGPSGLISRGRADVLPTGRNFYSLDPQKVPTEAGAAVGRLLADALLAQHLKDEGRYPENVAFYWQCTDIMWADGEGLAQMLHLLGVSVRWQGNGRIGGFDVIPLADLGRPRIDITVRASGLTRDNFPQTIDLLDDAIQAVAALDEPPEMNFVRKHSLERLAEAGGDAADAESWREANYRIFGAMPGSYSGGVNLAVYASAWETEEDLAEVFLAWNSFAYGKGVHGKAARNGLTSSLKSVDASFGKTMSDTYDLFGCPCHFGTHGGMINAARVVSGRAVRDYYGDTREQGEASVRSLSDEIRRVARGKVLNPIWIESMKEHGYKGAGDIMKRVGYVYGWQATSRQVDGAIFDNIARTFVMDADNRAFFEESNPYALEEMTRRLIEAEGRGLWQPAPDVAAELKALYVEIEGWIEERMADMEGDFQGGAIDVQRLSEVKGWQNGLGRDDGGSARLRPGPPSESPPNSMMRARA